MKTRVRIQTTATAAITITATAAIIKAATITAAITAAMKPFTTTSKTKSRDTLISTISVKITSIEIT